MRKLLLTLILFPILFAQGQNPTLEVTISGLIADEIYLADFYGDKNNILDTTLADATGFFRFPIKDSYPNGMYRIFLTKETFFDIIISNRENIKINSQADFLYDSLNVIESKENKVYYRFLKEGNYNQRKFDLLAPLANYYPRNDTFYESIKHKYISTQEAYISFFDNLIADNPDLWVTRVIKQRKPHFYDPELNEFGRREYTIEHFFDHVDFTDIELIRSNVYSTIAIEYLTLYSNPNLNQDQLQDEFIKAVDKIMYEAMDNSLVYEFVVEYLVGGFEKYHFDKVLDYIAENYTPEQCENEERKSDLQTRLKKYAELSVGKPAPEIHTIDENNNPVTLSEIDSDNTLIIFWASWCSHCKDILPKIHNICKSSINPRKMQVFSYSIDNDNAEWRKVLDEQKFEWINASDLKGWDSQAAIDYNIYATPTMFLLDKEKHILAKPITFEDLKEALIIENIIK